METRDCPSTLALKRITSFPAHIIITKENENLGKKNISNTSTGPSVPIKNRKAITESERAPEL